mgnify:CR=1 FL=1
MKNTNTSITPGSRVSIACKEYVWENMTIPEFILQKVRAKPVVVVQLVRGVGTIMALLMILSLLLCVRQLMLINAVIIKRILRQAVKPTNGTRVTLDYHRARIVTNEQILEEPNQEIYTTFST